MSARLFGEACVGCQRKRYARLHARSDDSDAPVRTVPSVPCRSKEMGRFAAALADRTDALSTVLSAIRERKVKATGLRARIEAQSKTRERSSSRHRLACPDRGLRSGAAPVAHPRWQNVETELGGVCRGAPGVVRAGDDSSPKALAQVLGGSLRFQRVRKQETRVKDHRSGGSSTRVSCL